MLQISDTLSLPVEFITASNAILAKKGAGKTNALVVMVEAMFAEGAPVVTIDPKGDHYGIRSSADGQSVGLPIPVFGGRHGDIPLEPTAGAMVADLVRDQNLSVVLDVSEFTRADRRRFLTAFADRIYRHPARNPMHLFLEECHEYVPQMVSGENAAMVGAFELLVKGGRFKGIGVTLVSQRSASVNKNVLTQVDNLFVMRTIAAQDRAAVKGWIADNADSPEILAQLPSLQNGEAWLWRPETGDPVKFQFRMRTTFDAGATPKLGEVQATPTTIADVDLDAVAAAMAETIEKASADDPKALRARIVELTRLLDERDAEVERLRSAKTRPALTADDHARLSQQTTLIHDGVLTLMRTFTKDVSLSIDKLAGIEQDLRALAAPTISKPPALVSQFPTRTAPTRAALPGEVPIAPIPRAFRPEAVPNPGLSKAQRAILTVLAQRGTQTIQQVAMLSGYTSTGGGFRNALGALRTAGYIDKASKDPLTATAAGLEALGEFEPLPTGRALADYWLDRSSKSERAILAALLEAYPHSMTQEEVAAATGYEPNGGGFRNSIGHLRTLTLITGTRDALTADRELGEAFNQ